MVLSSFMTPADIGYSHEASSKYCITTDRKDHRFIFRPTHHIVTLITERN